MLLTASSHIVCVCVFVKGMCDVYGVKWLYGSDRGVNQSCKREEEWWKTYSSHSTGVERLEPLGAEKTLMCVRGVKAEGMECHEPGSGLCKCPDDNLKTLGCIQKTEGIQEHSEEEITVQGSTRDAKIPLVHYLLPSHLTVIGPQLGRVDWTCARGHSQYSPYILTHFPGCENSH